MKNKYSFSFSLAGESLCILQNDEVLFSDITGYLEYDGTKYNVLTSKRRGSWRLTDDLTATCDSMTLELKPYREGFMFRSSFTNKEDTEIPAFAQFTSFAGHLHRTLDRATFNSFTEANGLRVNEMQSAIHSVRVMYGGIYDSPENTVFTTEEGDCFVFGQLSYDKYFSAVTFSRDGFLTAHASLELHPLRPDGTVQSEWFYFAPEPDPVNGLEGFAKAVAAYAGKAYSERENPCGFCTWYYYGGGISPKVLDQNIAVLDAHKADLPVKYIQIDDGWYDTWGSWKNREPFPDMPALVKEINAHGYIAGIWLAPFGSSQGAPLVKEHPEWIVKDAEGKFWPCSWGSLALDFTNPEVRDYMGKVFHRLSYEWGFRYIKMDIITGTLSPGRHLDPDATALQNYRLGLKTFRENVTPDTFLLGCTAPFGGAVGYVDGMRVSGDIFERWESLLGVFNAVLKRYFYHRNYFLIDADCLIIRKKENEDDECMRLCTRDDNEIRTYVTAMAASGGILMLSDKLPNLKEEQLQLISKLFPVNQNGAKPLDLMDSFIPGVLDFGTVGKTRTVALINWGNAPRTMSVQNGRALVFEFWEKQFAFHEGGDFSAVLPPHTAKVFNFTEPQDVCVIGSDASVKMQSVWNSDGKTVSGQALKPGETIYAAAKGDIRPTAGCSVGPIGTCDAYTVYEVKTEGETYTFKG